MWKAGQQVVATSAVQKNSNPLISDDKFRQLYTTMLRGQMVEERPQLRASRKAPVSSGQPSLALVAGIVLDLLPEDTVVPHPHDLLIPFVRGVALADLFSARDAIRPPAPSDPFNDAIGAAVAHKFRGNQGIAVAFSGNGPASLDRWQDSLRFAGANQLPVIFVVQDLSAESSRDYRDQLSAKAQSCGFPGIPVDVDDVVAVYRVAQESILRARRGGGPTLIEALRYSLPRSTSVSPGPIATMETYLSRKGLFTPAWKSKLAAKFRKELDHAASHTKLSQQERAIRRSSPAGQSRSA